MSNSRFSFEYQNCESDGMSKELDECFVRAENEVAKLKAQALKDDFSKLDLVDGYNSMLDSTFHNVIDVLKKASNKTGGYLNKVLSVADGLELPKDWKFDAEEGKLLGDFPKENYSMTSGQLSIFLGSIPVMLDSLRISHLGIFALGKIQGLQKMNGDDTIQKMKEMIEAFSTTVCTLYKKSCQDDEIKKQREQYWLALSIGTKEPKDAFELAYSNKLLVLEADDIQSPVYKIADGTSVAKFFGDWDKVLEQKPNYPKVSEIAAKIKSPNPGQTLGSWKSTISHSINQNALVWAEAIKNTSKAKKKAREQRKRVKAGK